MQLCPSSSLLQLPVQKRPLRLLCHGLSFWALMEGAAACGLAGVAAPLGAEVISCMVSARQSAPRNWAQLGPLDGATLARFVFGMFVWEGLFRAVQAAVWRQKEGRSAAREERELWHTSVPSYAVSTVHALILCWRVAPAAHVGCPPLLMHVPLPTCPLPTGAGRGT